MPSLLFYGRGGESESIMVSKENITEKVSNNTRKHVNNIKQNIHQNEV